MDSLLPEGVETALLPSPLAVVRLVRSTLCIPGFLFMVQLGGCAISLGVTNAPSTPSGCTGPAGSPNCSR